MKRILIIANSPLPSENTKVLPAAGLRTFQFLSPLIKSGGMGAVSADRAFSSSKRQDFVVQLVTIAMPEAYEEEPSRKEIKYSENFSHFSISKDDGGLFSEIQRICDEFHPDAVISVNSYPSFVASKLNFTAPLWADLNGWVMAEGQAQAFKVQHNNFLPHYFDMENSVLERADKISTVSGPQKYAVTGELALMGRLNNESFGYDFVHDIANGTEYFEGEKEIAEERLSRKDEEESPKKPDEPSRSVFEQSNFAQEKEFQKILNALPSDAFKLFWLGGYNTWVDEVTLFKGVDEAMDKNKNVYFISTGGTIKGLDDSTFARFKKMIDESKNRDRYIFLGWVERQDIPPIYRYMDLGLNIDRKCTETYTGARNRINEMMKFALPVATTLGSEISYELDRVKAGIGFKQGKSEDLAATINYLASDKKSRHGYKLKEMGEAGKKYIEEFCNYEFLMKPLLAWLENPRPAPDRNITLNLASKNPQNAIKSVFSYIKQNGIRKFLKKVRQRLKF